MDVYSRSKNFKLMEMLEIRANLTLTDPSFNLQGNWAELLVAKTSGTATGDKYSRINCGAHFVSSSLSFLWGEPLSRVTNRLCLYYAHLEA